MHEAMSAALWLWFRGYSKVVSLLDAGLLL
jgi:hypothetical protein